MLITNIIIYLPEEYIYFITKAELTEQTQKILDNNLMIHLIREKSRTKSRKSNEYLALLVE